MHPEKSATADGMKSMKPGDAEKTSMRPDGDSGGHGGSKVGEDVAFYGVFCLKKVAGPLSWESVHQVKVSE